MRAIVTHKGQVTLPKAVLDHMGIAPGSRVGFELAPDGGVVLVNLGSAGQPSGFARLFGVAGTGLTTDEVMAITRGEG
jgi:AbrB family looped-hinge helix DNA binding protein